jgi:hypothetical protein
MGYLRAGRRGLRGIYLDEGRGWGQRDEKQMRRAK